MFVFPAHSLTWRVVAFSRALAGLLRPLSYFIVLLKKKNQLLRKPERVSD